MRCLDRVSGLLPSLPNEIHFYGGMVSVEKLRRIKFRVMDGRKYVKENVDQSTDVRDFRNYYTRCGRHYDRQNVSGCEDDQAFTRIESI